MKRNTIQWLAAAVLLAVGMPQAFAQSAAGTQVTNSVSVDYSIGGNDQDDINATPVSFVVDRRVNLTVAEVGGAVTEVSPGETDQELRAVRYTVTNSTNDTIDIALDASDATAGSIFTGPDPDVTDTEDSGATFSYYLDDGAGSAGVFDTADDTPLPVDGSAYLDEVAAGANRTVWVVASAIPPVGDESDPTKVQDGDILVIELTATAHSAYTDQTDPTSPTLGTGALGLALTDDSADDEVATTIENVFADAADAETGNAAEDGTASDYDAFEIAAATISVTKRYRVYDDFFTADPEDAKAIPGALVLYCITVTNAGGTDADDVTIADDIPANTTFFDDAAAAYADVDPATAIRIGTSNSCTRADWTAAAGSAEDQDAIGADETDPNGGNYDPTGNGTVTTTVDVLPANDGVNDGVTTTMFMVEIN